MAKTRSPQYPIIGLEDAINKARLVWEKDYQSELPREVIAEHMGYRSLNGKSLGILSTVGKYGLLEGRGDQTRISDLAVDIFAHERGSEDRLLAILKAAAEPQLFKDINEKFEDHSPSNQALKSYLITRGFTLSAVDAVIQSYRDTEAFVKQEASAYEPSEYLETTNAVVQTDLLAYHDEAGEKSANIPAQTGVPTISLSDNGLEISSGIIATKEQFETLMRRLNAGKVLLYDGDE